MGRWAQYRKRGRGGLPAVSGPGFPQNPPQPGGDWETTSSGLSVNIQMLNPCPGTVDSVGVQYRVQPSTTWLDTSDCDCEDGQNVVSEQMLGSIVEVRARWLSLGVGVSDWSSLAEQVVNL